MFVIAISNDGPACATYTRERAEQAAEALKQLHPGERVWFYALVEDEVERLQLEVLCDDIDCEIAEELCTTLTRINGVVIPEYRRVRASLRGLVRNSAVGDSERARGTARTYELAEQHARRHMECCKLGAS